MARKDLFCDFIEEKFMEKFGGKRLRCTSYATGATEKLTTEPITSIDVQDTYDGLYVKFMVGKKTAYETYGVSSDLPEVDEEWDDNVYKRAYEANEAYMDERAKDLALSEEEDKEHDN